MPEDENAVKVAKEAIKLAKGMGIKSIMFSHFFFKEVAEAAQKLHLDLPSYLAAFDSVKAQEKDVEMSHEAFVWRVIFK